MTTTLLVACLITFATVIATVRVGAAAPEQTAEGNGLAIRSGLGTSVALSRFAGGSFRGRQSATRTLGVASESGGEANCRSARRGLAFYRARYDEHVKALGRENNIVKERPKTCARARYLADRWREKAYAARLAFERWHAYHYDWRSWLPAVWKRIIACETFSNFRHNSGTYQGAYGFHYDSWDRFRLPGYPDDAYEATPREQYEVALAIWRAYGYSGWGCA